MTGQKLPRGMALSLLVILPSFCLAQEEMRIEGRVLDAVSGQPVPAANVQVVGFALGSATDEEGRFSISGLLRGEYQLRVSHIAYRATTVEVGRVQPGVEPSIVVRLEPRIILLPQVEAVAQRDRSGETDRLVIDRKQIDELGASNLAEVLAAIPFVSVQRSATGSTVSIRGSSSGQVLVLFDDVPLNDPTTGAVDLESLPASLVESIEVVRSSATAQYGQGAIGGAVIIRPRVTFDTSADVSVRGGSYGMFQVCPAVILRSRPHVLSVSGDFYRWHGRYPYAYRVADEVRTAWRRNSDVQRNGALLQLNGRLRWFRNYSVHALWTSSERGLPGSVYALSPYARGRIERSLVSATVMSLVGGGELRLTSAVSRYGTRYANRVPANAPLCDRSVPPYDLEMSHTSFQLGAGWAKQMQVGRLEFLSEARVSRFAMKDLLTLAASPQQAGSEHMSAAVLWRGAIRFGSGGLMGKTMLGIRENCARVRAPALTRTYWALGPSLRLELSRTSVPLVSVFLSLDHGFRLPTYGDLFYQDYQVRGNPNLRPERSADYAVGARLHGTGGIADWTLQWEWFSRRIRDFITWRLGSFATFSPLNVDARMSGHEVALLVGRRNHALEVEATGQWLTATNLSRDPTVRGKALPYRPEYQACLSIHLGPDYARLTAMHRLVGPRWVTEANTVRLRGFQVLDLSWACRFRLFRQQLTLQAQVLNVADRRYEVLESAPLPGREWRLGFGLGAGGNSSSPIPD
jgi:outer membrane receptor protein involved in Fe transport